MFQETKLMVANGNVFDEVDDFIVDGTLQEFGGTAQ